MRKPFLRHSNTQCSYRRSLLCDSCKHADSNYEDIKNGLHASGSTTARTEIPTDAVPDKVVPLSGNPYFVSIVVKTQVSKPFCLVIPKDFYRYLPAASAPLVLSCRNRSWETRYSGQISKRRINSGWREFAVDNKLKVGDGCVYELMDRKNLIFRVQILNGDIPSELADADGDNPVIID